MKTKFLSLILLTVLFISCENELDKDLTLRVITSSKLSVNVVDSKGTPISNLNIKLYNSDLLSSTTSSILMQFSSLACIYSESTDEKGAINFGDVTSGDYLLIIDSVRINGLNYQPMKQFQINSNVDKSITIHPEDYATTFNFKFEKADISKSSPMLSISNFNNLNILFIPKILYSTYYSLDKLISLAEINSKTNATGLVSLRVPSFKSFIAVVYNDAKTIFAQLPTSTYSNYSFLGDKGQNTNFSFILDAKTLVNSSYGTYKLSVKKSVLLPTNSTPTLQAFEGLNVAAIPSNLYDPYLPLSMLLESVELSGKTDTDGNISFSLRAASNYLLLVYNDEKTSYGTLSSFGSTFVNSGETQQSTVIIDPTSLTPVAYGKLNILFNKTSSVYFTQNPTDLTPFSKLKVALIPYKSNNSTSSIDNLLSTAIASGITDGSGRLSFTIPNQTNYSLSCQILAYNDAKTTKFVSQNISLYANNIFTAVYMLNASTYESVN